MAIHRLAKFPESRLSESRKGFPKVIRLTVGVAQRALCIEGTASPGLRLGPSLI